MKEKNDLSKILKRHENYKPATAYLPKEVEKELQIVADKLGIPKEQVREVWISQFRLIKEVSLECKRPEEEDFTIESFKSVRLPYWGRWEVKKSFLNKYKK